MEQVVGQPSRGAMPGWASRLVRWLDDGIVVPGTRYRIGLDGLLGLLLPGVGDAITAAGALSLFWLGLQRGVPKVVLARMALNVAIDAVVGAVPIAGDLFDFAWKANRRNLRLLERVADAPAARRTTFGDILVLALFGLLLVALLSLPLLVAGVLISSASEHLKQ